MIIDDIKAIVDEYCDNNDYASCEAMEDIICVLHFDAPYFYNKIMKAKLNNNKGE